ncbi:MAG: hypothetical protein GXO89_06485, partial [Chlorobi bacterium]|nr:hypothetical protein [Chlorobiota bacterium]
TKNEHHFFKKFIHKVNKIIGRYEVGLNFCSFPDVDDDGFKEIAVSIYTGFTLTPRNLFLIDIVNDTVLESPESGTAIISPLAFDLDNDGHDEYMGESGAFGNWHSDVPFKDSVAWLMVIDKNMKFVFDPIPFGEYKTYLQALPLKTARKTEIVILQKHYGPEDVKNKLLVFDVGGNKIKEKVLSDHGEVKNLFMVSSDKRKRDRLFLFSEGGKVEQLDMNLNLTNPVLIKNIKTSKPERMDIDLDGKDEFLFCKEDRQGVVVTRNDFSSPVEIDFRNDSLNGITYSLIERGSQKPLLYVRCGADYFKFLYYKNPLYFLKYPLWISIYGITLLFLFLLQKLQRSRVERHYQTEKKIAGLQLMGIKNQIDPHFTLNLISSIGALFNKKDSEKADYVFGKYAKLLRTTILSSEKISIPLKEELEYITNYLDLEKFKYDYCFDYTITIGNKVDTRYEIPKMLVHTFVENALKHGIKHLKGKGFIEVDVKAEAKRILVTVIDNGVGRKQSKEYSTFSTGKGLKILDNILQLYSDYRKVRISYSVTDLYEGKDATGTKVLIMIPINIDQDKTFI